MRTRWAVIAVDNSSMPAVWEWTLPPHSVKLFIALHNSFQSVALQQCAKNESNVLTAIYFPNYLWFFSSLLG